MADAEDLKSSAAASDLVLHRVPLLSVSQIPISAREVYTLRGVFT
jgi:hypothetical protein